MKKFGKKGFKVFGTIFAACGISTAFTACYGMPINENNYPDLFETEGVVRADLNGNGNISDDEGVEGIKVYHEAYIDGYTFTDKEGSFNFCRTGTYIFEDVDGKANGGKFKTKSATLETESQDLTEIILEKETNSDE